MRLVLAKIYRSLSERRKEEVSTEIASEISNELLIADAGPDMSESELNALQIDSIVVYADKNSERLM